MLPTTNVDEVVLTYDDLAAPVCPRTPLPGRVSGDRRARGPAHDAKWSLDSSTRRGSRGTAGRVISVIGAHTRR